VSHDHADIAITLEGLDFAPGKLVLVVMAQAACRACGLAWPGINLVCRRTGLGATTVRKSLEWLEHDRHLIRTHAYPRGGRGVATEYILMLPGLTDLSTAPCGECLQRMKTHRAARGIVQDEQTKPTAARGVLPIPTTSGGQNPSRGDAQSVSESNQSQRSALNDPVENSPAARPNHSVTTPPLTASENAAQARALVDALSHALGAQDATLGPSNAATAPTREEAQGRDHPAADERYFGDPGKA
jgi:hypothetical protein